MSKITVSSRVVAFSIEAISRANGTGVVQIVPANMLRDNGDGSFTLDVTLSNSDAYKLGTTLRKPGRDQKRATLERAEADGTITDAQRKSLANMRAAEERLADWQAKNAAAKAAKARGGNGAKAGAR